MERLWEWGGSEGGTMTQRDVCESRCFPGLPRSYTQSPAWGVQRQSEHWELDFRSMGLQRGTSQWCLWFCGLSTRAEGIWSNSDEVISKPEIMILLHSFHCFNCEFHSEKYNYNDCTHHSIIRKTWFLTLEVHPWWWTSASWNWGLNTDLLTVQLDVS